MGARGIEDSSALPVREATYEILAELTLLPVPRLYKATLHRFASIVVHKPHSCASFTREDVTYRLLDIGESSKVVRSMDRPGYCPVCLKERRYHRIGWQLQPVVLCVDHGLALSVRCPNCNRLVSIDGIVRGECKKCKAPLDQTNFGETRCSEFEIVAQRVVQSWLGLCDPPTDDLGLPNEPLHALYHLMHGVFSCIIANPAKFDLSPKGDTSERNVPLPVTTPDQILPAITTAVWFMTDWPHNFHSFVQTMLESDDGAMLPRRLTDIGKMYTKWLIDYWQGDEFRFVRDIFDRYIVQENYFPGLARSKRAEETPYLANRQVLIGITETARMLSVGLKTVGSLTAAGLLANQRHSTQSPVFLRKEVEDLRDSWNDTLSLMEAAAMLGTWHEVVGDFVRKGLLDAVRGPRTDGSRQWRFSKTAIDGFWKRIDAAMRPDVLPDKDSVTLLMAVQKLGALDMSYALLLKHAFDGDLALHPSSKNRLYAISDLRVDLNEIAMLERKLVRDEGWITQQAAAKRLGGQECRRRQVD